MSALQRSNLVRWAGALFVASILLLGWTMWRHAGLAPRGSSPSTRAESEAPPARTVSEGAGPVYSLERLGMAVAKDPFHPERRAPSVAFRIPGEIAVRPLAASEPRDSGNGLQLVGTAVGSDGRSVAMCQWTGGGPRLVRVGEQVLGLTLARVRPGLAEFTTESGTTVVLRVPRAGS